MTIALDIESRSRADLPTIGGRIYWEHPSTEAICVVMHDLDTGAQGVWLPGDPPPFPPGTQLAAHNAMGFDRFGVMRLGWPTPEAGDWIDTSEVARRGGLPGALDALGTRWLGRAKDKAGSAFTKALSRPSRAKARLGQLPALTDDVMARVVAYCASDVEIMAHGWPALRQFNEDGVFASWERDVSRVDRIVNDRGVAFDSDLARALLRRDDELRGAAIAAAADACGWSFADAEACVGSPEQFVSVMHTPDATAATVAAVLADTTRPAWQRALAEARSAIATIAAGKLRAGLARVSRDGRLRDCHRYYGAHTGRWSGKGLQTQNITRPGDRFAKWGELEILAAIDAARDADYETIEVLLRACLCASAGRTLAVCDFSSVEARCLAWCAGDAAALETFKSGRNPYFVAAATIFGKRYEDIAKGTDEYDIGKKSELACGYGMGARKFEANYSPSRVGVNAEDVVRGWRELHAPIVRYWRVLEDAFRAAIRGVATRVWPFEFVPSSCGRHVAIFLPSGRPIVYNDVGVSADGTWPDGRPKSSPFYVGTRGFREHLYGGKIAENVIQATCRDMMAESLVRAEEAGLAPVLHVHDEVVAEVDGHAGEEALAELKRLMTTPPEWAEGFPVGAAGHHGTRYRK